MPRAAANVNFTLADESVEDHGSFLIVRGRASTFGKDRVGDTVTRQALERAVAKYMATNPMMLYEHKFDRPAGVCTKAIVRDDGLHIEARLPRPADPLNLTWWQLVRDGVLRALSIGGTWIRDGAKRLVEIDLRELSIAPVAVNGDAFLGAPLASQLGKAFGDDLDERRALAAELRKIGGRGAVTPPVDVALLRARLSAERLALAARRH